MPRRILTVAATTAAAVTGAIIVRHIFLNPEVAAMSEPIQSAPEVDVPTPGEPTTAGQPDTDAQPQGDAEGGDGAEGEPAE